MPRLQLITRDRRPAPFRVVSARDVIGLRRETSPRFQFLVPPNWKSSITCNPHAREAEAVVLSWFADLGCTEAELSRARRFDVAGYVGLPFPTLSADMTIFNAKFLSLWLLWDDVQVESSRSRWCIEAEHVLANQRPEGMTRFDEGWWQLFRELATHRGPEWVRKLCEEMSAWLDAAHEESRLRQRYQSQGLLPSFADHLELRNVTIGMYPMMSLLEHFQGVELPLAFHAHPSVRRLKVLASMLVGLGNEILSFGKDYVEEQINLLSTLMHERDLSGEDALACLISMHNEAIAEYDHLASTLGSWSPELDPVIERWLQDVRHASLGFSLWEAQSPRYTAHKLVAGDRCIEPSFHILRPEDTRSLSGGTTAA